MLDRSLRSLLRLLVLGALTATPLACAQVVASTTHSVVASANATCPLGSEGCACTSGGGCDPGLYCDGGTCVSDSYGGEDYEFADDLAYDPAPPAPMEPAVQVERSVSASPGRKQKIRRRPGRMGKRSAGSGRSSEGALAYDAAAETVDASAPVPSPSADDTPRDPADEVDNGRQVIYTATLNVEVFELDAAAELAESLPRRYGGWIESRYDYMITLRIRAEHLFDAIEELSELGVVLDRTLLAEDVTAEFVDLDSRIRVLEEMVAQLEALLARATSVEQALQIRVALDRVRIELEAARARMRQLSEMIDFSTLVLYLSQRGPIDALPSSNDPFPWVDNLGAELTEYR